NEAIKHSQLPPKEMLAAIKALDEKTAKDHSLLSRQLTPAINRIAEASARSRTVLQCAVVGLGVERFHMKNKRWPESWDEVVTAGFIKSVPIDGYDGQPLRFRETEDGFVVFSVGPQGSYAGDV